jgi:ribosomal protein S18 acetylase RimI-like enzyme
MAIEYKIFTEEQDCQHYYTDVLGLYELTYQLNAAPFMYRDNAQDLLATMGLGYVKEFAFDGEHLIGFSVLCTQQQWPEYLTHIATPTEPYAFLYSSLVHPEQRGRGIGSQLIELRIQQALQRQIKHLYVTVHPDNAASVKVLQRFGLTVIDTCTLYQPQFLRYLMYRAL